MTRGAVLAIAVAVLMAACTTAADAQPSVQAFEQALTARLLKLKPDGMTERNVLFQDVKAGAAKDGSVPFRATLLIRDYGPGYPANHYYGETCVSRMDQWTFEMRKDDVGGWTVEGRMTPDSRDCTRNPSAGVSATPVSSLSGVQVAPAAAAAAHPGAAAQHGSLPTGEYACYGTGSRLMAGMGFRLSAGGGYTDVDGKRGGTWTLNAATRTITFTGGFLGGQTGRNAGAKGFALSETVSCEPWK